jgi:hypothetical protein
MKKHEMEAVAAALARIRPKTGLEYSARETQWHRDCEAVAKALGELNHVFDVARFMRNCGVSGWRDGGSRGPVD